MKKIFVIAGNTFRETVRDKVLNVILVFALVIIASSILLGQLSIGQDVKIVKDLGLAAISLFGVAIAIFVGTSLVHKEIDKRTVFVVLTKPVGRHQFLLGKFFGLASTLFVLWAAMAATYLALVFFLAHSLSGQTFLALFFILVELVLLTALSLFFSTFASPVMSMVYVFSLFFVGHNSATWKFLAQKASPLVRFFTDVAYYVLPNLKDLDFKEAAVYALSVDPVRVLQSLSYGIAYTSFLLAAAVIVFSLREF